LNTKKIRLNGPWHGEWSQGQKCSFTVYIRISLLLEATWQIFKNIIVVIDCHMDKNVIVAFVAIHNWLPNVYVLFGYKKVCLRKFGGYSYHLISP
jgi:hypothetical protein